MLSVAADSEHERLPEMKVVPPDSPLVDVMRGAGRLDIPIHDHGFVSLVDCMPRMVPEGKTADFAIVQAARVSYGEGTKRVSTDRGLIRYLMRRHHTTPFEMVEFKFHVSMPVFVARQWIRHRTANVNEYSGRYSIIPDHFYRPSIEEVRKQSTENRQGSAGAFAASGDEARVAQDFVAYLDRAAALYADYEALVDQGVARELARIGLPLSAYTQWYWKCDLFNILHFLELRLDEHAQEEIRVYAEAMLRLIEPVVPVAVEAFRDYRLESMQLTRLELDALRARLQGEDVDLATRNSRERSEWAAKRARLGLEAPEPSSTPVGDDGDGVLEG